MHGFGRQPLQGGVFFLKPNPLGLIRFQGFGLKARLLGTPLVGQESKGSRNLNPRPTRHAGGNAPRSAHRPESLSNHSPFSEAFISPGENYRRRAQRDPGACPKSAKTPLQGGVGVPPAFCTMRSPARTPLLCTFRACARNSLNWRVILDKV